MERTLEWQARIDEIASVVNAPGAGRPLGAYESATDWEMRQLYAESWVNVGFADRADVSPWIEEGVLDAGVAFRAYRAGFRPTDPWVQRSDASPAMPAREPLVAPIWLVAQLNRLRAWRAWLAEEAKRAWAHRRAQRHARQLVDTFRAMDFDAGFGAVALDALDKADIPVTEEDVVRAYSEFSSTLYALRDLDGGVGFPFHLSQAERTAMQEELRYWTGIADALTRRCDVCTPAIRAAIKAHIVSDRDWLTMAEVRYRD
jgi:hypothetical protein